MDMQRKYDESCRRLETLEKEKVELQEDVELAEIYWTPPEGEVRQKVTSLEKAVARTKQEMRRVAKTEEELSHKENNIRSDKQEIEQT